jgi:hypothetical protein
MMDQGGGRRCCRFIVDVNVVSCRHGRKYKKKERKKERKKKVPCLILEVAYYGAMCLCTTLLFTTTQEKTCC